MMPMRGFANTSFWAWPSIAWSPQLKQQITMRTDNCRCFAGYSRKRKEGEVDRRTLSLNFLDEQVQRGLLKKHGPEGSSIAPCSKNFCMDAKIGWCGFPVYLEERNWQKLFSLKPNLMKLVRSEETDLFKKYVLPEGLKVTDVLQPPHIYLKIHIFDLKTISTGFTGFRDSYKFKGSDQCACE